MASSTTKKRHPVGPNWELCHKIAQGSFGKVYYGVHSVTKSPVAVKTEPLDVRHPQLVGEADIYMALRQVSGVPKLLWHGHVDKKFDALVLQLLGPDLDQLLTYCDKFSLRTVLLIADQLLDRLESLHKLGYVYRDIKPQNFAIGYGPDGLSTVHILDFGLAKRLPNKNDVKKKKKSSGLVGTARYASIGAHRGDSTSCANDLESLAYMMMYWLRGSLPWSGLKAKSSVEKYEKIMQKKLQVPLKELCKNHPSQMIDFIKYCRGYKNDGGALDYEYLHGLIAAMASKAKNQTTTTDGTKVGNDTFDWYIPMNGKCWPDTSLPDMGSGDKGGTKSTHPLKATNAESKTPSVDSKKSTLTNMLSRSNSTRSRKSAKSSKYAVEGKGDEDEASRATDGMRRKGRTKICVLL
tara:strand:- start:120 stop:1343 length:1224 start_codon:yes stop_codon:yes gene_type:complete